MTWIMDDGINQWTPTWEFSPCHVMMIMMIVIMHVMNEWYGEGLSWRNGMGGEWENRIEVREKRKKEKSNDYKWGHDGKRPLKEKNKINYLFIK